MRVVVARRSEDATSDKTSPVVNGCSGVVTWIGHIGASQARRSVSTTDPTLIKGVAFAITITFWDSRSSAHATIVDNIAVAIALAWQYAVATAHTAFVEIIASAIVHCGVWLVVARVVIRATNAKSSGAA